MGPLQLLKALGVSPTKAGILREIVDRGRPSERAILEAWDQSLPELDMVRRLVDIENNPRKNKFHASPLALRYETDLPLFNEGVYHYDVAGGRALPHIAAGLSWEDSGKFMPVDETFDTIEDMYRTGRVRVAPLSLFDDGNAVVNRSDDWMFPDDRLVRQMSKTGRAEFYPNEFEGVPTIGSFSLPPKLTVRDVINDPDLRRAFNFSVAVPERHPAQQQSVVFRRHGGLAQYRDQCRGRR